MIRLLQLSLFVLVANGLFAQGITSGSIEGRVDSAGSPVEGAEITATHITTGAVYKTASQRDGKFSLATVRVGQYVVSATSSGSTVSSDTLSLELGQSILVDLRFGGDPLTEVVILGRRSFATLDRGKTGATTNLRRQQFDRLPTSGRNFQDLTSLDPRASGFSFAGKSSLYNNLSVDGSTLNNVFGLTALSGEQTSAQLISLDAIQAIQVALSPYDVRQSAFNGAGVNAVTRSGDNEFKGAAYYYIKNQNTVGKNVGRENDPMDDFNYKNFGVSIGGPIIKNKLFFFVNAEREEQINRAVTYPANIDGNAGTAVESGSSEYNSATNLERLRAFLVDPSKGWTFDPGMYDDFDVPTQSTKFLAKIDWSISDRHKLMVRYNQTQSLKDIAPGNSGGIGTAPPGGRQNSINALPFSSSWYRQNTNVNSVIAELTSTFSDKTENVLKVGWSGARDFRQQTGGENVPGFPTVDILGPNGNTLTTFGPDPFARNSRLDQTIIQIEDNFTMKRVNHNLTFGTANEIFKFTNVATPQINGVYQYSSIQNFMDNVTTPSVANAPTQYLLQYAGGSSIEAGWNAMQLGVFVQDEYTRISNLRLTVGLRVDLPVFNTTLPNNEKSDAMTFNGGEEIRVDQLPGSTPLLSPRLGFNWDVPARNVQIRGGSGIFTSRLPFVWLSNQVTNNGLRFGSIVAPGNAAQAYNFSPTPRTGTGVSPTFAINASVPDFKFPQVWRSNVGIDMEVPFGMVATMDMIFSKDIHAVYVRDANMNDAIRAVDGDGRPQFPATLNGDAANPGRRINQTITQALVLDNSNKGYQLSFTAELKKKFRKDFEVSGAYAITDARDVNSQNLTSASGVFTAYPMAADPNESFLSYSGNYSKHKFVAVGSWRKEYKDERFASTISFTYKGYSGAPFSYTYGGDMNSDGITGNDLIYIPLGQNEILLTTTNAADRRTTTQIWNELDNYISQDKYLNKHRGEYAARNGATAPWIHLLNLRFLQDVTFGKNTLQLSIELINALNLIDSNWGVVKAPTRAAGLLNFTGYEYPALTTPNTETNPAMPNNSMTTRAAAGRPIFTFPVHTDNKTLTESFSNSTKIESRYQFQFGIKYIFN